MIRFALTAIAAFVAFTAPGFAQQPQRPVVCETGDVYDDFDFWLGEWNVYTTEGAYVGHNTITKTNGGCLILEHWRSRRGDTGDSMNFHDPTAGAWRQIWVNQGFVIDYAGGLNEAGEMVLEGRIAYHGAQAPPGFPPESAFRGVWTPREDGTVRQHFEQMNADGEWRDWFTGIYVRVSQDPRAQEAAAIRAEQAPQ